MQMLYPLVLAAAVAAEEPSNAPRFSSSVEMVRLSVTVQDPDGRYVTDLQEGDFTIIENGVRQDIASFRLEERFLNVTFLIDGSDSMTPHLREAYRAAAYFIEKVRPDTVQIAHFSQGLWPALPPTPDLVEAQRVLAGLALFAEYGTKYRDQTKLSSKKPEDIVFRETLREWMCSRALCGATALYTSIYAAAVGNVVALEAFSGEKAEFQRQIIILITDGEDTASKLTADDVLEETARLGIPIYTVRLSYTGTVNDQQAADQFLGTLAERTGGLFRVAATASELGTWHRRIAGELRSQYLIGYATSASSQNGQWRPIQVSIGRPGYTLRHKQGYYASCDHNQPCANAKKR